MRTLKNLHLSLKLHFYISFIICLISFAPLSIAAEHTTPLKTVKANVFIRHTDDSSCLHKRFFFIKTGICISCIRPK